MAKPLQHYDAIIRGMLVNLSEPIRTLHEYVNDKGYEGRHVSIGDVCATIAEWVETSERQASNSTRDGSDTCDWHDPNA